MRYNSLLFSLISLISFLTTTTLVFAGAVTSSENITISTTGGGVKVKSDNGNSFSISGRIMYDYDNYDGAYNADFDGDSGSESEFRRTRLSLKGTSGKNWEYKLAIDVEDDDNEADVDTAYVKYQGFENVDLFLGRLKAPAGLEELTSSKWTSTIERTVTTSDFGILAGKPDFQAQAQAHFGNFFGQLALIDEGNEDTDTKDSYSWALRAGMHFPFGEDNHFLHAATSYADRDFGDEGTIGFETKGGVHSLPGNIKVQNNAAFEIDDADQIGIEAAYVNGPFSVQSEYWTADFDGGTNGAGDVTGTDIDVDAVYFLGSWFLTGESRSYKGTIGAFDKIKPKGASGAWELVAKYETGKIDPDNQPRESEYDLTTLGVSWYANNNVKFMLNYLDFDIDNFDSEDGVPLDVLGEEDGNAVSFRAQYAF